MFGHHCGCQYRVLGYKNFIQGAAIVFLRSDQHKDFEAGNPS